MSPSKDPYFVVPEPERGTFAMYAWQFPAGCAGPQIYVMGGFETREEAQAICDDWGSGREARSDEKKEDN